MTLDRRSLLVGAGALTTASLSKAANTGRPQVRWKMALSWPSTLPGLGAGAVYLSKIIDELSEGEFQLEVAEPGALVGPLEVFDGVSKGF